MSTDESNVQTANVTRQGGVVSSMTMLSRISGLVRDIVLSYLFGASYLADMFFVALRVPNFFRRLFAEGAFNQAFVPVLMRYKGEGLTSLRGFVAPLSGLFSLVLVVVVVLGVVFAEELTVVFAPGFTGRGTMLEETAELVRITFPYLGFIALTAYAGALLNAHNRFALPAFTPVLLNLSLIGGALVAIAGWTESEVVTLAWAVLLAGVIQLFVQFPSLVRLKLIPKPSFKHEHEGVRQVGRLLVPAVLAASVGQINALVNTILASTLATGSIAWLYYADRLMELPIGVVAVALGTVMLPHLSRLAAEENAEGFKETMDWGIHLGLLLGLPAAVALYLLAEPMIAVLFMLFDSGAMTPYDARMAGLALELFAAALPGFVLVKVLAPAFFAHQNTQSPFRYAAGAVAVNLVVSLATFQWFGHVGLAWATALSAWAHVFLLYRGLKVQERYHVDAALLRMIWKSIVASILLGAGVWFFLVPLPWLEMTPWIRAVSMLGGAGVAILAYAGVLYLLGTRVGDLMHRV